MRTGRQLATDPKMCMFVLTTVINLKWLWKNKKDKENIVIRNKARVVAKGDHHERLHGFFDPDHPEKVYRLRESTLWIEARSKSQYEELSTFLISKGFTKDADYTGFLDTRKSTSDRIQFLGDKLASWMSEKIIDLGMEIDLVTGVIDLEEVVEMVLGIKAPKAQDKSMVVTIVGNKVISLVSVQILKRTRLLLEELRVIVKTAMKHKRTQHVSWWSTLK
nr:hypothetical protein [Tanacetum cinerariifolium]